MEYNLVNLEANYYELVMQDKVSFTMQVESKEKTKEATLKSLKTKVKEVQEIFGKKKLVAQLTYQTVNEEQELSGSKWKKTGYFTGSAQVQVIAHDFDLVNEVVDQLVEENKAQVGQIMTGISDKTKQQKEEEFTTKAIEVFQAKAKNIAKAFGVKDYNLVNISVNSVDDEYGNRGRGNHEMAMASMRSVSNSSNSDSESSSSYISPRESKISVTIQGTVEIK